MRTNVVRWAASAHVAALALQLAIAITFLSGTTTAYDVHKANAWIVVTLGAIQALTVIACGISVVGRIYSGFAFSIVVLELAQIELGRMGQTGAHALLGLALWGLGLAFLIKVWSPAWGDAHAR